LLIYISTDYVFPGKPGEAPYEVNAPAQPINLYGQTKLDGEKAVLEETKANRLGIILRVPVLYGTAEEPKESVINVLVESIWKAQEKDALITMDDWAHRYPTNTEDVGRVCVDLGSKYLAAYEAQPNMGRIFHFSSEDRFTKYEICQLFAEILGLPLHGMRGTKDGGDPNAGVQRPYDTHLSNQSLKELGINVQTQSFKAWWCV
jgi:S-adenosylmethionine synthetase